ncbi:M60 family metallopeptidase [Chryseobacterium indologenes]|uniref:M60 family metallopeptidase n=1 Tax=Chryseobacterium indologenes TaxID=253 RepID=UPI001313FAE6|nr:M60 family metallopeptidase [Chryseobacterium indologenes]
MRKLSLFFFLLCGLHGFSQLIPAPVNSVTSSQPAQPGTEVTQLIDGNNATIYHTNWSVNGIPDELKFYFNPNVTNIKKLIYTPRQASGTNGIWTNVSISYSTQTAPDTFIPVSNNLIWALSDADKEFIFPTAIQNPYIIKITVNAGSGNFSSGAEMKFFSELQLVPASVNSVTSSQPAQPGTEVTKLIDGNNATIYHTNWSVNGIPDELKFYFNPNVPNIRKLIYTPRQASGTNGIWTNVSISYSTQAEPNTFIPVSNNLIWALSDADKEFIFPSSIQDPYIIKITVNAGSGNFSSGAEVRFFSQQQPAIVDGIDCPINTSELSISGSNDVMATITPSGTTASSYQPGEDIDKSYDNNVSTIYHSAYGSTVFPVVLNYRLDGVTPIDYLKYTPRPSGDNGLLGSVSISYNTSTNSTYVPLMTFDFQYSTSPVKVYFPNQITPLNVRITVNNGKNSFASCAEMGFYKSGASVVNNPYSNIFTDNLYSALKSSVTQADINNMTSPFYKGLAQCLFNGTYVKKYRVQNYSVYPPVSVTTGNLKVGSGYSTFENPTGIVFAQGEKVALFAQNIPAGAIVSLKVKDFSTSLYGTDSYYEIHNGLNVFPVTNSGLGYINYYNTNAALPDIKINIVSGKVNGLYHYQKSTQSDWEADLTNSAYNMIDVVGQHVHMVYKKSTLKAYALHNQVALVSKLDLMVKNEWLVMGLYKYNLVPKNRMFGYSNDGGGWHAGGLGINMDANGNDNYVADINQLSVWGFAHEFGHINQISPDLKWIGTTEVTNNIYSAWVDYNMSTEQDGLTSVERFDESPAAGMASVAGGRINGGILNTTVNKQPLQDSVNSDNFKVLIPFWQLELYYQLAGASRNAPVLSFNYPTNYTGVDYAHWFATVANKARNTNSSGVSNGDLLLNFVKNTCDAVQEDLTEFFTITGFLRPINRNIDDYGFGQLTITQAQIDATIASIKSKNYQKPVSPVMNYISARSVAAFRDLLPVSGQTGQGVTLNNNYLTVQHSVWRNAVAYETFDANNKLIYVSVMGTGDVSNNTTKVYYPSSARAVYAVGYNGQKILVYPVSTTLAGKGKKNNSELKDNVELRNNSEFIVYPNPVEQNGLIHIKLENASGNYSVNIFSADGRMLFSSTGNIEAIETKINTEFVKYPSGTYSLSLKDEKGNAFKSVKVIKK